MKINLKREGGFMGVPAKKSVKLGDLSVEERSVFESLLEEAAQAKMGEEAVKIEAACPTTPPNTEGVIDRGGLSPKQTPMGADMYSYTIKTKIDGKTVTLKFDDTSLPENMHLIFQKYLDQE
ncbi:MAG: hypothetical protein HC817_15620 [Saprospiraceae bacterium]|nr:hypothetical protein [Saprospiraceae bacterium]